MNHRNSTRMRISNIIVAPPNIYQHGYSLRVFGDTQDVAVNATHIHAQNHHNHVQEEASTTLKCMHQILTSSGGTYGAFWARRCPGYCPPSFFFCLTWPVCGSTTCSVLLVHPMVAPYFIEAVPCGLKTIPRTQPTQPATTAQLFLYDIMMTMRRNPWRGDGPPMAPFVVSL